MRHLRSRKRASSGLHLTRERLSSITEHGERACERKHVSYSSFLCPAPRPTDSLLATRSIADLTRCFCYILSPFAATFRISKAKCDPHTLWPALTPCISPLPRHRLLLYSCMSFASLSFLDPRCSVLLLLCHSSLLCSLSFCSSLDLLI